MVEVGALALHGLMGTGQQDRRLLAAVAPPLPPAHPPLRLRQLLLGSPEVAGVLDGLSLGGDEEHLQPHVDARLASRRREWLRRDLHTRERDVPAIGLARDRDGLRRAFQWARPPHRKTPDLRQHQETVVQPGAAVLTHLRIGEALVAVAALEARIPWLLACFHAAEERLVRLVQAVQDVLQDLGIEVPVVGTRLLEARQLCRLPWQR